MTFSFRVKGTPQYLTAFYRPIMSKVIVAKIKRDSLHFTAFEKNIKDVTQLG